MALRLRRPKLNASFGDAFIVNSWKIEQTGNGSAIGSQSYYSVGDSFVLSLPCPRKLRGSLAAPFGVLRPEEMKIIDQFINFVIRPPRAEYNPDQYLWESEFSLAGRKFKRQDLELVNGRGHTLKCSHYFPASFLEDSPPLPCVIYCHGNR